MSGMDRPSVLSFTRKEGDEWVHGQASDPTWTNPVPFRLSRLRLARLRRSRLRLSRVRRLRSRVCVGFLVHVLPQIKDSPNQPLLPSTNGSASGDDVTDQSTKHAPKRSLAHYVAAFLSQEKSGAFL